MKSNRYPSLIFVFIIITFCSCNKGTEPVEKNFSIVSQIRPEEEDFVSPADTTIIQDSPFYSVHCSSLELKGADLFYVKYTYPVQVDCEFVISQGDSFTVEIKGCKKDKTWLVDLGDIKLSNNDSWINSEVQLIRNEKSFNPDSTVNNRFTFKALKNSKGYVCFIETDRSGSASSNDSHGLVIGYDINPLDKVSTQIFSCIWEYNTEEGSFSSVRVRINGTTNAYRLRGVTYGDGLIGAIEIPISNNNFDAEIPVAFSHVEGVTLTTSTKLIVYGTIGSPKIIRLINPKSQK